MAEARLAPRRCSILLLADEKEENPEGRGGKSISPPGKAPVIPGHFEFLEWPTFVMCRDIEYIQVVTADDLLSLLVGPTPPAQERQHRLVGSR